MAMITMWESGGPLLVTADTGSVRIDLAESGKYRAGNYIRVSLPEAVKLRDDLSAAILEAATVTAKAKAEVTA